MNYEEFCNKQFLLFVFAMLLFFGCKAKDAKDSKIIFTINSNVENYEEDYFKEILNEWKNYLNSNNYLRRNPNYWNHNEYAYPEMGYASFLMYLRNLNENENRKIQCSILGIVPVKNNYYLLKTIYTEQDSISGLTDTKFIVSVYAKKQNDTFKFCSSTKYYKEVNPVYTSGNITYIVHPNHKFNPLEASKMNAFNENLAKLFKIEPIHFDYVVANNTRDLSDVFGLNFFQYSLQPAASGGMADNYNTTIYAGNNSEYYPHELVHLYTYAKYRGQYYSWIDEGIAALLGGSTGYKIEWHWENTRRFFLKNPDFELTSLSALETNVPNGEFITDFRYAIGALICQRIIDKEGMQGIFEALQAGRIEDDYYRILEKKLDVNKSNFEDYVKSEFKKLKPISDLELEGFKY